MAKLISKVYGDALLRASLEQNSIDETYEEIVAVKAVFEQHTELKKLFESPRISREDKIDILKKIFAEKISVQTVGFMIAVLDKARQDEFDDIFDYVVSEIKEYKKIGIAYVYSAVELSTEEREAIKQKLLETTTYESFEMHYTLDESLIGGLVIRIKDRVIDSSIKTRLYEIKKDLLKVQLA